MAASSANFFGRSSVRVAVIGDPGTGKTSLIASVAGGTFTVAVPPVLPPTLLPTSFFPESIPVTIVDTSSSPEDWDKLIAELKAADAIVLTCALDNSSSIHRLTSYWLPELRRLQVTLPLVVAGCKLDLRRFTTIMHQFTDTEVEACLECSALTQFQVAQIFYFAHKAVLYPTAPLYDKNSQSLQRPCVGALKRIFMLIDHDRDGFLSDAELNNFQVMCFKTPLEPSEISNIKEVMRKELPNAVTNNGLTLSAFLFLHEILIKTGRIEITWMGLRRFGYDSDLCISTDLLPTSIFKCSPDQSVELTTKAVIYLRGMFYLFDTDNDEALKTADIDQLFSTAPESPWSEGPYKDATERNVLDGLSLTEFLSKWALMTLLDPIRSMANLIYIGYNKDPPSAFHVTRQRRLDRECQQSERNVIQCFVFGPKKAGKSALLDALIGRTFSERDTPTTNERFAANLVELLGLTGNWKTLVMREVPEDLVKKLLSKEDSLAACDIAVFVYDSSDGKSCQKAMDLLVEVATHGKRNGFEVPCLVVSAKDDLDADPLAIKYLTRVREDMGIEAPIPVSIKSGENNDVFSRILTASQDPHLNIPATETGMSPEQYFQLGNRSLLSDGGANVPVLRRHRSDGSQT